MSPIAARAPRPHTGQWRFGEPPLPITGARLTARCLYTFNIFFLPCLRNRASCASHGLGCRFKKPTSFTSAENLCAEKMDVCSRLREEMARFSPIIAAPRRRIFATRCWLRGPHFPTGRNRALTYADKSYIEQPRCWKCAGLNWKMNSLAPTARVRQHHHRKSPRRSIGWCIMQVGQINLLRFSARLTRWRARISISPRRNRPVWWWRFARTSQPCLASSR